MRRIALVTSAAVASGAPSRQSRIDHDIGGDPDRAFVDVSLTSHAGVPLEGAADVELGIDDRPVVVDLDSFELRKTARASG